VARSAHALDGTVPGQGVAKSGAGELVAPVAVKDYTAGGLGLQVDSNARIHSSFFILSSMARPTISPL
jgi:hypothetical protein